MNKICFILILLLIGCKQQPIKTTIPTWQLYNETEELQTNQDHEIERMQYKLIQSKYLDKNKIWESLIPEMQYFSQDEYVNLKPLILEQNIPTIQGHIQSGALTYEQLVLWYLHRIVQNEIDSTKSLHSIIALNPYCVEEARKKDKEKSDSDHLIYGMPILLKDNINTREMRTTAGALALAENQTGDAFITERLKSKGAIILGKVNLSEWAYFFCRPCPVGYSAIGGQTLNPYGRMKFETGGSSSGSGTTMAANYAVGAVGTETSGSILSPSSKNSVVGLKPTIGLLSRSGIVPISSTLDTPGPMTKSVTDNAILLSALSGHDPEDPASQSNTAIINYKEELESADLNKIRLGANNQFLERDSLYALNVELLRLAGATIVEFDPPEVELTGFGSLLGVDMQYDLPKYLGEHAAEGIEIDNIKDVLNFNLEDTLIRAPYGQSRLAGASEDTTTLEVLETLKTELQQKGRSYFKAMDDERLDAVLSVDNFNAGAAAVAKYPCLTIPMGYKENGEPTNLTFIGKPFSEQALLKIGYQYEKISKARKIPDGYQ